MHGVKIRDNDSIKEGDRLEKQVCEKHLEPQETKKTPIFRQRLICLIKPCKLAKIINKKHIVLIWRQRRKRTPHITMDERQWFVYSRIRKHKRKSMALGHTTMNTRRQMSQGFISNIRQMTLHMEGRKKKNLKFVRYNVNGECQVVLATTCDIAKEERLYYYDYNGYEHEYPTHHFV
ncbi:putative Histone-lysine N-methyltransferase ATXR5 [Camellia lanceoleosa]|uniref:Histone-lysine N-methyltransferase ATXR5 n=1 Tax=Camellia lanceoleosa TaxID=1840588 RepID=A0ACC0F5I3_9ERIC|nr:putative Histone-lysine N-methyltransferase ATXR5 [Camellia lanceoleosa]